MTTREAIASKKNKTNVDSKQLPQKYNEFLFLLEGKRGAGQIQICCFRALLNQPITSTGLFCSPTHTQDIWRQHIEVVKTSYILCVFLGTGIDIFILISLYSFTAECVKFVMRSSLSVFIKFISLNFFRQTDRRTVSYTHLTLPTILLV